MKLDQELYETVKLTLKWLNIKALKYIENLNDLFRNELNWWIELWIKFEFGIWSWFESICETWENYKCFTL